MTDAVEITPEVKAERMKLWTAALRSGEYPQAKGYLKTDEGFCCLGVACEVAIKNGLDIETNDDNLGYKTTSYGGSEYFENSTLPREVMEWYGIDKINPSVVYEITEDEVDDDGILLLEGRPFSTEISELNDTLGFDFNQLADLIDDQLVPVVTVTKDEK